MDNKQHWEQVYTTKASDSVSWFQEHAEHSLQMIKDTGLDKEAAVINVGGGASTLVDDLLAEGYSNLAVLDISGAALNVAKQRLGKLADAVKWIEGNITDVELPVHQFDIWHDRAVFHFLTVLADRQAYVKQVMRAVRPGGHVIVATFAEDGPEKCSGLAAMRYCPESLHAEFGDDFLLIEHKKETHQTPFETKQQFIYCYCRKSK
jgi:ubiquinone/menaquinone biosynthesis C-methylase UbiE